MYLEGLWKTTQFVRIASSFQVIPEVVSSSTNYNSQQHGCGNMLTTLVYSTRQNMVQKNSFHNPY
jgi:hypothetical protein